MPEEKKEETDANNIAEEDGKRKIQRIYCLCFLLAKLRKYSAARAMKMLLKRTRIN